MRRIWEALENNGDGVVTDWDLQRAQRVKLEAKLDMLRRAEVDPITGKVNLPPELLAGPNLYDQPFLYKMKIHGNVAIRPLLCRGPVAMNEEWTVLARAVERGNVLTPREAPTTAAGRRQQILHDRTRRNRLR